MGTDGREWTGAVTERLRCCICGEDTTGADDYVLLRITAAPTEAKQFLGVHASHLNEVLAEGFAVDIHHS
ncbi:hypothetical protein AMIS_58870 [Actinoplanes missouriensis 431]|uniref:Uncharacterized protein n=1 Tax=Actinoplanes missouriensis (strain ATCC 14538 / DSM 43046 / CBS 188.64 / JCM 3121 / NBRC 102363 / NCIMB 12654 / NRRL B-3342 / UNCC 431) TaxID=512565 RepID=I0HDM0_ACTM4|nr:hypothetical protein [Actinoplanes missouriensis]BAL91107.1 hypothetical protein AMIS_58870 [Actinoplanes missouriensis 431]